MTRPCHDKFAQVLRIVKISEEHDLCLVDVGAYKFNIALGLGDAPQEGDYVAVVGFPLYNRLIMVEGEFVGASTAKLLDRAESKEACKGDWVKANPFERLFSGSDFYCVRKYDVSSVTAHVYPGNSGSALVDEYGEVVGVIFITSRPTYFGGAVPLSYLKSFLDSKVAE